MVETHIQQYVRNAKTVNSKRMKSGVSDGECLQSQHLRGGGRKNRNSKSVLRCTASPKTALATLDFLKKPKDQPFSNFIKLASCQP